VSQLTAYAPIGPLKYSKATNASIAIPAMIPYMSALKIMPSANRGYYKGYGLIRHFAAAGSWAHMILPRLTAALLSIG
jgi:hypothetical protein